MLSSWLQCSVNVLESIDKNVLESIDKNEECVAMTNVIEKDGSRWPSPMTSSSQRTELRCGWVKWLQTTSITPKQFVMGNGTEAKRLFFFWFFFLRVNSFVNKLSDVHVCCFSGRVRPCGVIYVPSLAWGGGFSPEALPITWSHDALGVNAQSACTCFLHCVAHTKRFRPLFFFLTPLRDKPHFLSCSVKGQHDGSHRLHHCRDMTWWSCDTIGVGARPLPWRGVFFCFVIPRT